MNEWRSEGTVFVRKAHTSCRFELPQPPFQRASTNHFRHFLVKLQVQAYNTVSLQKENAFNSAEKDRKIEGLIGNGIIPYKGLKEPSPILSHPPASLTTGPWVLDGDEGLAQALRLASDTVVDVGVAVLAAHGLVGAVTLDGIAGTVGAQLFHQTHGVEETLLLAFDWKGEMKEINLGSMD